MRSILAIALCLAAFLSISPILESAMKMVRTGGSPFLVAAFAGGMLILLLITLAEILLWLTGYYTDRK